MSTAQSFKHPRPFSYNPSTSGLTGSYFGTVSVTQEQAENLWWNLQSITLTPVGEITKLDATTLEFSKTFTWPLVNLPDITSYHTKGPFCGDSSDHSNDQVGMPVEPRDRVFNWGAAQAPVLDGVIIYDTGDGTHYSCVLKLGVEYSGGSYLLKYQFSAETSGGSKLIYLKNTSNFMPTGTVALSTGTSSLAGITLGWASYGFPDTVTETVPFSLALDVAFFTY